jgi:hypothetical protein
MWFHVSGNGNMLGTLNAVFRAHNVFQAFNFFIDSNKILYDLCSSRLCNQHYVRTTYLQALTTCILSCTDHRIVPLKIRCPKRGQWFSTINSILKLVSKSVPPKIQFSVICSRSSCKLCEAHAAEKTARGR